MLQILIYFLIATSLSMDAFTLSLSLGTIIRNRKERIQLSTMIGIFHFIMPIAGCYFGSVISTNLTKANYLSSLIFFILAIEIYFSKEKDNNELMITPLTSLVMALTVSIDSFSVGIALGMNKDSIIIAGIIFMIVSSALTNIGIILGNTIQNKDQNKAKIIGFFLLILISIKYLIIG